MRRFLLIFVFFEKILFVNFTVREGISIEPAEPPLGFVTPAWPQLLAF
jgi:hypothetical protein